jgi:hypothetical protein
MAVVLSAGLVAFQGRGGGGGGPQNLPVDTSLRFRYMGPAPAGRIASVSGVPGDPTTYYLGSASGGVWKSTDSGQTFAPIFDDQPVQAIGTIAVAPSDHNTIWVGTGEAWIIRYSDVMGDGVYKSTDAGTTWKHMGLPEAGRIAKMVIHPTNPNIVYACVVGRATGPQQERGVFKTTDGGVTWTRSLFVNPDTGCSGLSLDEHDPNTLLAGTWQILETTWGEFSGTWKGYAGTPGSGVYITHDGGANWKKIEAGMPKPPVGKIDVAIAPSDGKRMYALIQTADQGSLWRSDDGGNAWSVVSWDRSLIGRAGYYIRLVVNPKNADDVLISSSSHHRSINGGKTFSGNGGGGAPNPGTASCGDCHDIWMDPENPARYVLTDDGGAQIATGQPASGGGPANIRVSLPNGQMYHVAVDNRVPYWIYSNRQDDGTMRGPSTVSESTGSGRLPEGSTMDSAAAGGRGGGRGAGANAAGAARGGARGAADASGAATDAGGARGAGAGAAGAAGARGAAAAPPANAGFTGGGGGGGGRGGGGGGLQWQPNIGGCESGFTIPDPTDANIVWATCYGNKLTRWDARTNTAHSVEPWMISLDSPPNEARYRCHWTSPLAIDPFDHNSVYYGCQKILKTSNEGRTWTEFSQDLSTQDPSRIVSNGGLVGDNLGQFDGEVVWSIAPSPIQAGLMWAGTNDGKLWYTRTGHAPATTWVDVTKNIPNLPAWAAFAQISPSNFDPGTAYVVADVHLMDNRKPYVYKTTDFGATWTQINGDLPTGHPLDYMLSIAENPNKKGMLFAGSGHGFYYSLNDGAHWTQLKDGLPAAPVGWIVVEKRFHDVVLSTYGRGLYILPNISLLEQTGQVSPPPVTQLFRPNPVIRLARSAYESPSRPHFVFMLAEAPQGQAELKILDTAGKTVKTLQVQARQGLNGVSWNLQYEPPTLVALKTTPAENPHIWEEPRFQNTDTRRITHWGITGTTGIPIAAPGKYTVTLTVDGKTFTQPFDVIKDPAVSTSDADLVASTKMQVQVRDDITATSGMVNQMELWRKQIEDQLKTKSGDAATAKALTDLNKQILDVELKFVTRSEMLSDDKYFPEAYRVYMNLIWLSGAVGQGASDEAGGPDYHPTDAQGQVLTLIEKEITAGKASFDSIKGVTIPAFNKANAGKAEIK